MAPCWSAKEVFASLDLLCTVAVKHLIFIIASNFISSELMEEGLKKPEFYRFGWKSLSYFLLMPESSCHKF